MAGINSIVITGDMQAHHRFLFEAFAEHGKAVSVVRCQRPRVLTKMLIEIYSRDRDLYKRKQRAHKNVFIFREKSLQIEEKIKKLKQEGRNIDVAFHFFSLCAPFWHKPTISYVMYLDYTMALAEKTWPQWAPFRNRLEKYFWNKCERKAYEGANHLFAWTDLVKKSLERDYRISGEKITVVGSAGNFKKPYRGERRFGSKQIAFIASDFVRKNGPLVLEAFKKIKKSFPDARLLVAGEKIKIEQEGVIYIEDISSPDVLERVLVNADLLFLPSQCEPASMSIVEAMNYGAVPVVSAAGGSPSIVDNGVNGIVLVRPTAEALAESAIALFADRSQLRRMSEAARHKVKTKMNWDVVAGKIIDVLQRII